MAVSSTSHQLTILGYSKRPDRMVVIRFVLHQPGVYWNLPFASKAFQPGDTLGIPMTPALGDPQHNPDPITVSTFGHVLTWVWNAPADGFADVTLSGWTLSLGFINLFCCEGDEPEPRFPEDDLPPPTPPTVGDDPPNVREPQDALPPDIREPIDPIPAGGDQTSTNNPLPGDGINMGQVGVPVAPAVGGFVLPPPQESRGEPYFPGGANPLGLPASNYGYGSGSGIEFLPDGSFRVGDSVFNRVGNTFFDPYWNPVHVVPTTPSPTPFQPGRASVQPTTPTFGRPGETVVPGLRPTAPSNFPATVTTKVAPVINTPQGTSNTQIQDFEAGANLKLNPTSVMSTSIYTLPSTDGSLSIAAEMYPSVAPRDIGSTVFASITNASDSTVEGLQVYSEGLDEGGSRYVLNVGKLLDPIPAGATVTVALCTSWMSFINGPVTIVAVLMGPGGQPLLTFSMAGQATPPGTLQPPPTAVPELPASVRDAAWGAGASDIDPVFEGSYNAVGNEDFYIIDVTSSRVGIVVKITPDALLSGFQPVLKIFSTTDLDTPLVTASTRFAVPDQDKAQHAIGWRDFAQLPILQQGQRYLLQVVHRYPFYSRRWGFKIYTRETVAATVLTGSVDGNGNLEGSITSPYGRQSLKIVNDRTLATLFVRTDSYGQASDVQVNTSPVGDTLAVNAGDILRVYRPGMAVQYRSTDLLTLASVSA
jgi:hypothetical protein